MSLAALFDEFGGAKRGECRCQTPSLPKVFILLVTLPALKDYLVKERALVENDTTTWKILKSRLMVDNLHITCDSYGPLALLSKRLLPVVCHRNDLRSFAKHKETCLTAAAEGAVLVSARIARGEQDSL